MNSLGSVLLTGGAGAIGSQLVRKLLAGGAERIAVVDSLTSGYEWLLPDNSRVQFYNADVCNLPDLGLDLQTPLIFHLAAFFANQNSVDYPLDDLHTNGQGTLATLLWAERNNARAFVYASAGCSIAGHGIEGAIHEDMPVSLFLDTPYQITKALGEFYCNYFLPRVNTVRCRFFNSYGPGEVPGHYRNVIPNFIWAALHGRPLTITGTGEETRDFIFVDDLVEGLLRAGTRSEARGQAINLGTGRQTRIVDLAKLIIQECGSSSEIQYAPRRAWDKSVHREADIDRARQMLGLNPTIEVKEGIARTVRWFEENRERIGVAMDAIS